MYMNDSVIDFLYILAIVLDVWQVNKLYSSSLLGFVSLDIKFSYRTAITLLIQPG